MRAEEQLFDFPPEDDAAVPLAIPIPPAKNEAEIERKIDANIPGVRFFSKTIVQQRIA
jgi:hypothetical protein